MSSAQNLIKSCMICVSSFCSSPGGAARQAGALQSLVRSGALLLRPHPLQYSRTGWWTNVQSSACFCRAVLRVRAAFTTPFVVEPRAMHMLCLTGLRCTAPGSAAGFTLHGIRWKWGFTVIERWGEKLLFGKIYVGFLKINLPSTRLRKFWILFGSLEI